jgi:hypothetical protein
MNGYACVVCGEDAAAASENGDGAWDWFCIDHLPDEMIRDLLKKIADFELITRRSIH